MEPELINLIASTTGPIGTVLVVGFMWIRSYLLDIKRQLEGVAREAREAASHRATLERRLLVLELRQGVPGAIHQDLTPVTGPG